MMPLRNLQWTNRFPTRNKFLAWLRAAADFAIVLTLSVTVAAQADTRKRPFSISDDIEMLRFPLHSSDGGRSAILPSPDGRLTAVMTERGIIDRDVLEHTIWIWKTDAIEQFLTHEEQEIQPKPIKLVQLATFKESPIISQVRWLDDSKHVVFLAAAENGSKQLYRATISTGALDALTPKDQDVVDFQFSKDTVLYAVKSMDILTHVDPPGFVVGKSLFDLLFPLGRYPERLRDEFSQCDLWAIRGEKHFRIEHNGQKVHLYVWSRAGDPQGRFRLSPDGRSVAVYEPVDSVPQEWTAYQRLAGTPEIRAGTQDLRAPDDSGYVKSYFLINLLTGSKRRLVDAPEGTGYGWWDFRPPLWSPDGRTLFLPNTFLPLDASDGKPEALSPCASVYDLKKHKLDCLLHLTSRFENPQESLTGAQFDSLNSGRLILDLGYPAKHVTYQRSADGVWRQISAEAERLSPFVKHPTSLELSIRQGMNDPPLLVARDKNTGKTRALWDPNPQFKRINLGNVSAFHWKDETGHEWNAGLVMPPDYQPGKRYPLVLQTHWFSEGVFFTYGAPSRTYAARELAAAGIVVLQIPDDLTGVVSTPQEAPHHVAGFEGAIEKLAAQGLIDPNRVGVIGFSRTCYYVMHALTAGKTHFAAAEISDGVTYGYWGFLEFAVNAPGDDEAVIGGSPFGEGLKLWLARSPDFNLDRVRTPLLIVEQGGKFIFGQWEEYAGLRYLKKPVELLDLGAANYEHVFANPRKQIVAQNATVDWFRFWLKGEEDPDPQKTEQYKRWREMRGLKEESGTSTHSGGR
jgi:dipeptidyl aminopeptidase/acylaminoacyl peptidase